LANFLHVGEASYLTCMGRCALGARLDDVVHRCAEKLLVVGFFAFLRRAVPQRDRPSRYSYDKSNGPKRHAFVRVGADPRFLCINLLNLSKKKKIEKEVRSFAACVDAPVASERMG
jgi:hypothetical protein